MLRNQNYYQILSQLDSRPKPNYRNYRNPGLEQKKLLERSPQPPSSPRRQEQAPPKSSPYRPAPFAPAPDRRGNKNSYPAPQEKKEDVFQYRTPPKRRPDHQVTVEEQRYQKRQRDQGSGGDMLGRPPIFARPFDRRDGLNRRGQPLGYYQPPLKRQQTVALQQIRIDKLEQTVEEQKKSLAEKDKEVAQLKAELQKKRIQETVSEKLTKYLGDPSRASSGSPSVVSPLPSPIASVSSSVSPSSDYSQGILLRRINLYLVSVHKDKISEKGYCHGIVLLWLTMMSWGVEKLFFEMIKVIAECPEDQLSKIGNIITLFLDWIEVGQNPEKYSNQACSQQDVDEIIGEVNKIFAATKNFSMDELEKELQRLAQEKNMMSVTGWWVDASTKMKKGHTVGVFVRKSHYHFFDPNFKKLGDLEFFTEPVLVKEIWGKVFTTFGVTPVVSGEFSLNVVHRQEPAPLPVPKPETACSRPMSFSPTFYGGKKQPVASPTVVSTKEDEDGMVDVVSMPRV